MAFDYSKSLSAFSFLSYNDSLVLQRWNNRKYLLSHNLQANVNLFEESALTEVVKCQDSLRKGPKLWLITFLGYQQDHLFALLWKHAMLKRGNICYFTQKKDYLDYTVAFNRIYIQRDQKVFSSTDRATNQLRSYVISFCSETVHLTDYKLNPFARWRKVIVCSSEYSVVVATISLNLMHSVTLSSN